jgi:RHS repeat-associated protein
LLSVILPNNTAISYINDPLGRRIAKKVNGIVAEKYLWQGLTKLLAVYDGNDNLISRFEYSDGRIPTAMTQGGSTYYLGYDQVGSLRTVVNSSGSVVKEVTYDSFGNILSDSNATMSIPFGFAGGLYDNDIQLTRFGFRDYDAETGRWTAKDPVAFSGGDVNLYGYVFHDPVNLIDPTGQVAGVLIGGIAGAYTGFMSGLTSGSMTSALVGGAIGGLVGGGVGLIMPTASSAAVGALYGMTAGWFGGAAGGAVTAGMNANGDPCATTSDIANAAFQGGLSGGLQGAAMGAAGGAMQGAALGAMPNANPHALSVASEMIVAPVDTALNVDW